jgi:hypothetical protein
MNSDRSARRVAAPVVLAVLAGASTPVFGSCGAASCTLTTDRFVQGSWDSPGLYLDLRAEYLRQDQLLSGSHRIGADQVTEDTVERETINRNLVATLDWAFGSQWAVSLRLPYLNRQHVHDVLPDTPVDPIVTERWDFHRLGDVQVLGRYQLPLQDLTAYAVTAGLKLPTGSHTVANDDGAVAERSLQPGTGTTDLIVGASVRRSITDRDALFATASLQAALNSRDQFRPGEHFDVSIGSVHQYASGWSAALQLNVAYRGRDSGAQAEPDLSGSTTVQISPGVNVPLGGSTHLYGFVQLPLYQHVNGIQLLPRWSMVVGVNTLF